MEDSNSKFPVDNFPVDNKVFVDQRYLRRRNWGADPLAVSIAERVLVEGTGDAFVLVDGEYVAENLLRIDSGGATVWAGELPDNAAWDFYVSFHWDGTELVANSWSGYRVTINVMSGRISRREFTK
jgi:hypothetical protein